MTEKSLFWTTGGSGDGASTYTRADWSKALKIAGACRSFEGVAPNFLNELVGSVPSANTARIGTGGALVDGKPYENSAPVDVTIPSAVGAGNTRIDRIVLRANWTAQTVRITRIPGSDAVSPTAPVITQTSETTYDIMLYQALVTTAGVVTLTDERVMADLAAGDVSSTMIADGAVITAKIPDASIPNSKLSEGSMPYGVQVTNSGALTIPASAVAYTVPFNSEVFDDDTMHDNSTNNTRLTCKRAGRYFVTINIQGGLGSGGTYVMARITKNGTSNVIGQVTQGPSGYILSTSYFELALNDYLELVVAQNGTGTGNVNSGAALFSMAYDG
ncbi:MAG: hypothetical protein CVU42_13900 [Chloroflexi bacterium HGW-Chloroflexi-4]|jgi:hypothetical protein|nr:MAG: hypothetical protein CVU42_13900 [Chloroflexi bacterium HGW-Chloroflexi-4]